MSVRSVKRERFLNVFTVVSALKIEESDMVKVAKTTADQRWGRNDHHFHFNCAKAKGGLEENDRAVNQLLTIVRSKNNIGQDKKGSVCSQRFVRGSVQC